MRVMGVGSLTKILMNFKNEKMKTTIENLKKDIGIFGCGVITFMFFLCSSLLIKLITETV